jgi:hypothetical protein
MSTTDYDSLPSAVREFRPRCPGCTPHNVTAEGARPCSFYDCPGLPKKLEVTCDTCMFDFAARDGQPKCDHKTCETALRLQKNVETYRSWIELLAEEAAGRSELLAEEATGRSEHPAVPG